MGGPYGWVLFGINLACGLVGIVLNAVDLARWKKLSLVLYLIMGWMAVLAMPVMLHNLSRIGFLLILLGGLPTPLGWSSIGKKDKPYRHGIWHFFVLAGTVFHFFAVYTNCCFYRHTRTLDTLEGGYYERLYHRAGSLLRF